MAEDDADEQVDAQWKALCAAVPRADTALVMHMPDHYSLVHAVRQWTVENRARLAPPPPGPPARAAAAASGLQPANAAIAAARQAFRRMRQRRPAHAAGAARACAAACA